MHCWGDDWFKKHGHKLDEAIYYCIMTWRKWGRISTHGKEKYGTFRDQASGYGAWWAVHELVKPGHMYYRWSKRVMWWDIRLGKAVRWLGLHKLFHVWQRTVYNYAIQKMCRKYPEITDELVCDLDLYFWVKPGIFGSVDGEKIHNKYWKRIL